MAIFFLTLPLSSFANEKKTKESLSDRTLKRVILSVNKSPKYQLQVLTMAIKRNDELCLLALPKVAILLKRKALGFYRKVYFSTNGDWNNGWRCRARILFQAYDKFGDKSKPLIIKAITAMPWSGHGPLTYFVSDLSKQGQKGLRMLEFIYDNIINFGSSNGSLNYNIQSTGRYTRIEILNVVKTYKKQGRSLLGHMHGLETCGLLKSDIGQALQKIK